MKYIAISRLQYVQVWAVGETEAKTLVEGLDLVRDVVGEDYENKVGMVYVVSEHWFNKIIQNIL